VPGQVVLAALARANEGYDRVSRQGFPDLILVMLALNHT
jgi:hypothetical protein